MGMTPEEIEKMVKNSRKSGDFDKDWKDTPVEENVEKTSKEPDPADNLPPVD